MPDPVRSLIDPFTAGPGPQAGETGLMPTPSKPTSLIRLTDDTARLEDAARRAVTTTPDQAARLLRVQQRTGFPVDLIERNLELIEKQTAAADFDVERFRAESPLLARWLADHPSRLALVHDDLRPLSRIERALGIGGNVVGALGAGVMGFSQGIWGAIEAGAELSGRDRLGGFAAGSAQIAEQLAERARGTQAGAGFVERSLYSGIESVGQMAPGLVLAAAGGGVPAVLGAAGVTTGGQSYAEARAQGEAPGMAAVFGGLQGAIEVATEYIPAHRLLGDLAAKSGLIRTLVHQIASEIPGEEIATAFQDLNEYFFLQSGLVRPENQTKTFHDYLAARPSAAAATAIATLTAVGLQTGLAHGTVRVLEQLGGAARESQTIGRAPDQVRALIDGMTADGPLATVGLPIDQFTEYFQSKAIDPAQMAAQLTGDPEAFARARQTGEDLAVPMGRYLTELAGTEHGAFFTTEAKLTPEAPNVREAQALDAALTAEIAATATEAETPATSAGQVRDAVLGLLADVFPPQVARVYAEVAESAFQRIGTRAGVDPLALFQRYGLTVARTGLAGGEASGETALRQPGPEFVPPGEEAADAAERRAVGAAAGEATAFSPDEPLTAMADLGASALRMLGEDPEIQAKAEALRQRTREVRGQAGETGTIVPASDVAAEARPASAEPGATRRRQLEQRIAEGRARGREDVDAVAALQALRDAEATTAAIAAPRVTPGGSTDARSDPTSPDFFREDDRGTIRFGKNRQFRMELLQKADLSTFLHEFGHFYLEVLGDVVDEVATADAATLSDDQRQLQTDYRTLLTWFGVDGRGQITEAHHEQFARGFEAYLMEGKAPSAELRSVFARVRAWLLSIYRSARTLRSTITPEVRAVMDRMLATDEAIAAAQRDTHAGALFTAAIADAAGLSSADRAGYRARVEAATATAQARVQGRLLADLQRERADWWTHERAALRTEVAAELGAQPVYRALALLQEGRQPDGSPLPAGTRAFKLDLRAMVREIGPHAPLRLPPGISTTRMGVAPAVAAELLGFPSVPAMVKALAQARPFQEAIDLETDARMRERHGDLLLDGSLLAHARDAVLDAGAEVFAEELRLLAAAVQRQSGAARVTVPPVAALRAAAERRIAETRIRDLRPSIFEAAARRAGDQALEAATRQDFRAALAAKQRQILNAELYRAAMAARTLVDEARAGFQPIFGRDGSLAPRYNMDLVHAARALLGQFELASGVRTEAAHTYLQQVAQYDPALYHDLQAAIDAAAQAPQPFRDLTVNEFTALRDAVASLWHTARRSRQIVIAGQVRELDEVRTELQARLLAITPRGRQQYRRKLSAWAETKRYLLGFRAALRRVESWVDAVDGGDPQGVFRRYVFTPISEAASRYREAKQTYLERYLTIVQGVEASLTPGDLAAPELDYTFSGKAELLHAVLHTGNASNLRKLLLGDHETRPRWGAVAPDGSLDTSRWDAFVRRAWTEGLLTKADYDYVQGVWDLLEELKPQAQQVHHDVYGYYFSEITAQALQTPFGTYRGGYAPALYDPFLDDDAARRADKAAVDQTPNSFMFPSTGRGFTQARIDEYVRPLMLDLRVLPLHLDKVLRFVHLQPAVKDAGRLAINKPFRRALGELDPTVAGELLVPWLQRAARQTVDTPATGWGGRGADRFFRALRRRTGLQIMVGNVLNALQQVTGLSMAAVKVPIPALSRALWRYVRGPKVLADLIAEKSAFMRTRTTTQTIEIQSHIDDLLLNPSRYEQARAFATKHGYVLQAGTQNVVDLITWSAGYDHAIAEGATEPEAVQRADSAVRETQGSFNPEDLSTWETGSPAWRMFSMFYSYFNMQANLLGTQFTIATRDLGLKAGAGRLLYVYLFGFLIPAVLSELIIQAGRGRWDDDEDGLVLDDLLALFFGAQQRTATAMVPLVGPIINAGIGTFTRVRYDDRISVSPAISALESAVRAPHEVYEAIVNDGRKKPAIRDTLTSIGLLTGLPVAPLGRPLGYLADISEGEVEPTGPVDVARGLVTGR